MGTCVEKLPHSCGTERGLQVFLEEDGRYTGHCFSCGEHVPDPYKERPDYKPEVKVKTEEDIKQELAEIRKLKAIELPERELKKRVLLILVFVLASLSKTVRHQCLLHSHIELMGR